MSPGLSVTIIPPGNTTRCWTLVTAGLSLVLATWRSISTLISVDLPTLGTPAISARRGRSLVWRSPSRAASSAIRLRVSCGRSGVDANAAIRPSRSSAAIHARVTAGSARSLLVSTLMQGLSPRSSPTTGFVLAAGSRASITSIARSCDGMSSASSRRALVMWPGYHWTAIPVFYTPAGADTCNDGRAHVHPGMRYAARDDRLHPVDRRRARRYRRDRRSPRRARRRGAVARGEAARPRPPARAVREGGPRAVDRRRPLRRRCRAARRGDPRRRQHAPPAGGVAAVPEAVLSPGRQRRSDPAVRLQRGPDPPADRPRVLRRGPDRRSAAVVGARRHRHRLLP